MSLQNSKRLIIRECTEALESIDDRQGEQLVDAILKAGKVYFCGVGRVLLSLQGICKRLAHLGIDAHYVGEISEPAITEQDLLIIASGSGESVLPKTIAEKAKKLNVKIAWIGSNQESSIARLSSIQVRIPVQTKLGAPNEMASKQPMTSLFEQTLLLYGDAVAMEIAERKHLEIDTLWQFHANLE